MKKIWRALTFNLSQALYPLIPDLYGIFRDLAEHRYISSKQIHDLSQNIYIIVSAIMLFALGIKLLTAIVNPDLLDDKKKGAKQTFFRCVAALFLIVLVPMGFNKMYDVQKQVIEDQLIEKVVLGMDTSNSSEPGQVLAAYAFASFCEPNSEVSSESIVNYYNSAIVDDINDIDQLDDAITSKTDGKWDLNYHPILSPVTGFFICYEMVLLCIDIALRSLKLALLQLLTPLILCAYILVGDDVLQKWAKEVISTFALLFVKVGTITFLIFGLSIIPNFLKSIGTAADGTKRGFFYTGILRVFIIIGLLQLVKQFPDILSKLLGVDFKYRGGIRGRLGEMQGVGEMAQKAWDKIRSAGTAIATKAGLGMAALASGPLGWGAMAGAGALAHGWRKGFKNKETGERNPWRDTNVGRSLRKFGAGAKAVGKGLTTKGGFIAGTKAAIKSFEDSGITKDAGLIDNLQGEIKRAHNIGGDNRVRAVADIDRIDGLDKFSAEQKAKLAKFGFTDFSNVTHDSNGNVLSAADAAKATAKRLSTYKDALKTIEAREAEADVKSNRDKYLKGKMSVVNSAVTDVENAARNKAIADAIKSKHGSLVSTFDEIKSNTTDDVISSKVASLKSDYVTGQISSQMAYTKLSELLGSDDGYVRKFKSDANKFEKLLMNDYINEDGTTTDFGTAFKRNAITGGFVITDINDRAKDTETVFNNTKGSLDQVMSANNFNETQKATVQSLISNAQIIYDSIASTGATFYDVNSSGTGTIAFGDGITMPDMVGYVPPVNNNTSASNASNTVNSNNSGNNSNAQNQNMSGANINGATINVTNLNAQNVNAQNLSGNLNANSVDTSNLTGNADNVDAGTVDAITEAVRQGISGADINAAVNNVETTATNNYNNQNTDDTYMNGGFDTTDHSNDRNDDHDEFDQFYDDDY